MVENDASWRVGQLFDAKMARGDVEGACGLAMDYAAALLVDQPAEYRGVLFDRFFKVLDKYYSAQYQSYDFEICDYDMFSYTPSLMLFRGPRPSLADIVQGRYVTVFGAAQLFGRFHKNPFHIDMQERLKFPLLNLSMGGAGPSFYLQEPFLSTANRGVAVVLQVLSARSVGCDEYPGMRMTARAGSSDPQRDRIEVATSIWNTDPAEALRLAKKWQANYLKLMIELIDGLNVPVYLVWLSSRSPGDWSCEMLQTAPDFGSFPQLVDASMVAVLKERVERLIQISPDPHPVFGLTSRLTGEECPFFWPTGQEGWINDYYPSDAPHRELANALETELHAVIRASRFA